MKPVVKWAMGMVFAAMMASGAAAQGQGSEAEAFLTAIREQDGAKATEILGRLGESVVNYRGYDGDTPLTLAISNRNAAYIGFLLGGGAEPDLPDKSGDTPLIIAARTGFVEGLDRLAQARATIDATNRQGETALIVAVQGRHAKFVRRLLELGADPDKTDFAAGYSARDYARRNSRNPELLRMIESVKPIKKVFVGPVVN